MQVTTLVIALLAGVSEARRSHHYRLMAADPPSGATCYRGNQKQYPVSGNDTPPCWFAESDNSYSCYEYEPSTGKCPNFPNPVSKPGKPVDNKTCYRGNQKQYPVSGKDTPPCWYRESDGSNSCYEYEPTTGKCPNFPNPISKPTFHLRASSHRKHGSSRNHLRASSYKKHGSKRYHHYSLKAANPPSGATCFKGNQKKFPVSGKEAPPCWFAESNSSFSCYEYEPSTGQCPKFPNPVSKPSYRLRAQQAVDSDTCFAGNMRDKPIQDPKRELCWYKQGDGVNACFAKIDGRCPF